MEEQNPSPQSPKERHQLRDGGRGQQEDGTRRISTLPRQLPPSHTSSSSRPQLQQPRGSQGRSLIRLTLPRSSQGRSLTRLTSPRSSQGRSLTRLTLPRSSQGRSLTRLTLPRSSQGRSLTRLTLPRSSQGRQAWSVPRLTSSRSTLGSGGTESRLSLDEGCREQGSQGRKSRPGGSVQPAILASRAAARGQHRPARSRRAGSGPVRPEPVRPSTEGRTRLSLPTALQAQQLRHSCPNSCCWGKPVTSTDPQLSFQASVRKPVPDPPRKASQRVDQDTQTETWAREADSAVQYAEQETQTDTVAEEEKNSAAPLTVDQETETETPIQEKSSASPQITDEWTQTKAHSSAPSTGTEALADQQPPSPSCRAFWRSCTAGQPHAASVLRDPRDSRCSRQPLRPEHSTPEKWGWTALPPYSWPWLIEMNRF
ncbi:uncharacterized protein LOC119694971 [Motacilla alba alba]|uniref:uncharacterized protein LOC119694971 n=1 Tax=Motacilla alba alba TaxID=1094192 RepID=UPI0018D51D51|nr:uncharacterized protein LOC119694971 [Motacilla alba alba]